MVHILKEGKKMAYNPDKFKIITRIIALALIIMLGVGMLRSSRILYIFLRREFLC